MVIHKHHGSGLWPVWKSKGILPHPWISGLDREDESDEETIRSASEEALDQSENANSPANTDSASAKISDQPMIYPMQQLMDYDF